MIAETVIKRVHLPIPVGLSGADRGKSVGELFTAYEQRVFTTANSLFWWLLVLQWAFSLVVAVVWSPRAWVGTTSSVHPHVIAAVVLGGLLVSLPLLLMRSVPYHPSTRHCVAVAQVCFSALLIHLTGGRIETHFHVFGSLAFLALYRDWRVIATATVVAALDHLLRGLFLPESVYGVSSATLWRTWEHAAWVIFEATVLIWACFVSRREMREICVRQHAHQTLLDELENRVRERTRALEAEMTARERTVHELGLSEERYRTFVTNLPIGVFKTSRSGKVHLANPHLLNLLHLPANVDLAVLNMTSGEIFPKESRERFWTRLEAEGEVRGFETALRTAKGNLIDVVINARVRADSGDVLDCEGTLEDVTARRQAAREVDVLHQQLVTASRQAGMADVATGVLHNVGNVLTSVNITVHDVKDRLSKSRLSLLRQVSEVFQREKSRLGEYLTVDPAGKQVPDFLIKLEAHLSNENQSLRTDVQSLTQHFDHIRKIIMTQQSSARLFGVTESLTPAQLFEDALKLVSQSFEHHRITIERIIPETVPVDADRHKVLQILVNLLKNAKDSVLSNSASPPLIRVRVAPDGDRAIALVVEDSGVGITAEDLAKIFQHGFTTKADGHGFGLHSAILAAREMGGDLKVASEGRGHGARFTLTLPLTAKPQK